MDAWYHLFITIYDKFSKHNENAKCECWWYDVSTFFLFLHALRIPNPLSLFCIYIANTLAKSNAISRCVHLHTHFVLKYYSFFRFIFAWKLLMIKISSIFPRNEFVRKFEHMVSGNAHQALSSVSSPIASTMIS